MTRFSHRTWERPAGVLWIPLVCSLLSLVLSVAGCKSHAHTSDPQLRKIDDLLDAQLPKETPRSRVEFFLSVRGYKLENSLDKSAVVALIRHVDTDTFQPVTARVTFHFDSSDKLIGYELQPAPTTPLPP